MEDEDLESSDLDPRVRAYIEDTLRRGSQLTSPDYLRGQQELRTEDAKQAISRAQMGGISAGLSKLGTFQGKSPDVTPVTTTLDQIGRAQEGERAAEDRDLAQQEKMFGMNAKVLEYLQGRKDKQAQAQAVLSQRKALAEQADQTRRELAEQSDQTRRDIAQSRQNITIQNMGTRMAAAEDRAGEKASAAQQKRFTSLKQDLDPARGRAGEFGKEAGRINAADRVMALALDENGQPRNLTKGEMTELASSVATMIANGGVAAQHTINELTPQSLWGNVEAQVQFLSNRPQGADMQAFVKRLADTAQREKDVAREHIRNTQAQRISEYDDLRDDAPDKFNRIIRAYGFDPADFDENLAYKGKKSKVLEPAPDKAAATPGMAVAAPKTPPVAEPGPAKTPPPKALPVGSVKTVKGVTYIKTDAGWEPQSGTDEGGGGTD